MQHVVSLSCVLLLAAAAQASLWDLFEKINIKKILEEDKDLLKLALPLTDDEKLALGYAEDTVLNFTQLATKYGYESAEYSVITEDGYILTLFRLWSSKCTSRGTPVLSMQEETISADVLLAGGPGRALGYVLADNCQDVWAGNSRGIHYSRAHTTLDPDVDADFWEYSIDQVAAYDVPAFIDFVMEKTGYSSLNYIGFGQGIAMPMMMCSNQAPQCAKLNLLIGMSPGTRMLHTRSPGTRLLFEPFALMYPSDVHEVMYKGSLTQTTLEYICQMAGKSELLFSLCKHSVYLIDSNNEGSIAEETFPMVYRTYPAGTSARSVAHYAQAFSAKTLSKFDFHNKTLNLAAYGSATPPAYDLSRTTAPVVLLVGRGDHVMDIRDTHWAAAQLPNLLGIHEVGNAGWNHLDFLFSQNIPTAVLPTMLRYLNQYTSTKSHIADEL